MATLNRGDARNVAAVADAIPIVLVDDGVVTPIVDMGGERAPRRRGVAALLTTEFCCLVLRRDRVAMVLLFMV